MSLALTITFWNQFATWFLSLGLINLDFILIHFLLWWYIGKLTTPWNGFAWTQQTPHRRTRLISFWLLVTNRLALQFYINPLFIRFWNGELEYLTLFLQAALLGDDMFLADIEQLLFAPVFCQLLADQTNFAAIYWCIKQYMTLNMLGNAQQRMPSKGKFM